MLVNKNKTKIMGHLDELNSLISDTDPSIHSPFVIDFCVTTYINLDSILGGLDIEKDRKIIYTFFFMMRENFIDLLDVYNLELKSDVELIERIICFFEIMELLYE